LRLWKRVKWNLGPCKEEVLNTRIEKEEWKERCHFLSMPTHSVVYKSHL
jgi:hypothetical protein